MFSRPSEAEMSFCRRSILRYNYISGGSSFELAAAGHEAHGSDRVCRCLLMFVDSRCLSGLSDLSLCAVCPVVDFNFLQVLGIDFSQAFIDAAERMRKGEAATACIAWDGACTCRQRHSEAGHI